MTDTLPYKKARFSLKKLRSLHILLVEDNQLNIKLASLILSQNGLIFQVAENGSIAVEKIREQHFDIVLMDMEMPVMNGYQATKLVRYELKSNIPIIALTAHTGEAEREKCLQMGMNDHIAKPIDEKLLFASILHLTGLKKTRKANPAQVKYSMPGISEQVCNLGYLINVTRGNKKMIHNILGVFTEEIPEELSILTEAIKKTNYVLISNLSHKLKSSFSILGIPVLQKILEEMEALGSLASGIDKIKKLYSRAQVIFARAMEEIKAETSKA